ncbi:AbrB/MazE/SpoVT family DNA-binding domain-containing protein [Candidatus Thiothrix sp. Deng01]|uniref:AbrB/MazE/SpoVT family DNA-binding domain-containing protein n=1 Tax=Candidatus Thiothrix phosphatis TaxID=3112415 RepID=A0ABU6CST8_9GAMM|nr:AbrB/MazE/SpoVT family DNA-binding domain-containing protein [Candidatus Thiothrix sp. Deng01]MEB4589463.1 AbrB/MazE/SpoVT family DNA-binding domain-containing protein [Candidatus Thiothrix sp. Deng01]
MQTATLSSKYQLAIPKAIREQMNLQAGQQFTVLAKGNTIELVPIRSLQSMRGLLKGANPAGYRDRQDRF